ncbi:YheC/YheD family protein [Ammoniphilus sp. 3BR4]|uniref:YheC/YheD family protein n=1 Tax=Ammoniphilus sp. 3BR4 TaxID=3158265 RepID=UPI00346500E3
MNFNNFQVKGHYFQKKGGEIYEEKGVYRFPAVVYMQCHIDREICRKIEHVIGRKVFNNFIFDKWQGWELLSSDIVLRNHLPATQKLLNGADLQKFLYHHQDIFVKPVSAVKGHSSKGIIRVQLQKSKAIGIFYREGKMMRHERLENWQEVQDRINIPSNYILQQSIQTVKRGEKVTDIRVNMSKNRKGKWEVSNLLFRMASNSSHIIPEDVKVFSPNHLEKTFHDFELDLMTCRNVGYRICHIFEKLGYHMGDLGIDLGIDENGHVWIFEVNPLPYPFTLSPSHQDHSWTRPLEYASYLAYKKR